MFPSNLQEESYKKRASGHKSNEAEEAGDEEPFRGRTGQPGVHVPSGGRANTPLGHFANMSPSPYRQVSRQTRAQVFRKRWGGPNKDQHTMRQEHEEEDDGWGANGRLYEGFRGQETVDQDSRRRHSTEYTTSPIQESPSPAPTNSHNSFHDPLYHSPKAFVNHGHLKFMLEEMRQGLEDSIAEIGQDIRREAELRLRLQIIQEDKSALTKNVLELEVENFKLRERVKTLEERVKG